MSKDRNSDAAATLADPRWQQLVARDASADGSFVYSVRSTGVYCRPACAARTPRPENVAFHADAAAAAAAGFRPCKRCQPDQPARASRQSALVAELCHLLSTSDPAPDLAALARHADLSPFHLHRIFKSVTGVTPKTYAQAARAARLREALAAGDSVTTAIHAAGFGSSSRFYAQADDLLGMGARAYRNGGTATRLRFAIGQCTLGAVLVAETAIGVCAIALGDDPESLLRDLQDRFPRAELLGADPQFEQRMAQVIALVDSPGQSAELPLDIRGTAFQQRVWQALRAIPAGSTVSYAELAQRIGQPSAVRAVASACAANVLAVAIPCHRVVRTDGGLSGYRWGVARKRSLLERERG